MSGPGAGDRAPSPGWARWELPGLLVTLAGALILRLHDFALAPAITDNGDEFDWAWMGLGLLRKGVPYGWSNLRVYPPGSSATINGRFFEIVHPFLDHPPLFGLIVGAVAWLQGARELTDVTAGMVRPVPIVLSILTLGLAYMLGRRVFGPGPAMVAAVLLATAPAAVLVQRQTEAESLLAPILLGALLLVSSLERGPQRTSTVACLLACCAVAPAVKVSGVAVAGAVAAILLARGHWRLAFAALASGLAGTAAYFVYGALYDWHLFIRVLAASEARRSGITGVYQFIAAPAGPGGADQRLRDGWWLLGWLMVGAAAMAKRRERLELLVWPIVGYTVVIMTFAEHVSYYGWFRVTVYPLIYLLAGWFAWKVVRTPSAPGLLLLLTLGMATSINALFATPGTESWAPNPYLLLAALAVSILPVLLVASRDGRERAWARYVAGAALGLTVVANVVASANLALVFREL